MARSDMDVNVLLHEPDAELWMHGMDSVGVGGCWTIDRLVDGGDRLAVGGDFVGWQRALEVGGLSP